MHQLFPTAAAEFSKWFGRGMSAELKDTLVEVEPGQAEDALFGLFAPFALTTFSDQIKKYRCKSYPCVCSWQSPHVLKHSLLSSQICHA